MKLQRWLPSLCLTLCWAISIQNPLFWDTIQFGSYHPTYFFETDFNNFLLPIHLDSGHPPYFGMYIAFFWTLLGRELWVTHVAMFPFVGIIGYFSHKLSVFFANPLFAWCVAIYAVVLGQIMLVSPDVVLLAFWLSGVYGILTKRKWLIMLSVLILGMVSMRGMVAAVGLFGWQSWLYRKEKNNCLQTLSLYIPGGLLAIGYFFFHYAKTGWLGYHANSTWANSFLYVDFPGLLKNLIVFGWRLLDFGLVFIWLSIIYIFFVQKNSLNSWGVVIGNFGILLLINVLLFAVIMLPYSGLMGHRYLLPVYASLFLYWTQLISANNLKRLSVWVLTGLLLGNLWFYPQPIATGWDSTPLHFFYFSIRKSCVEYLQQRNIPLKSVGSAFPNLDTSYITDLSTDNYSSFSEKNLRTQQRIFYSNVFNNFSKTELNELQTHWIVEKQWGVWPVVGILYQKPEPQAN